MAEFPTTRLELMEVAEAFSRDEEGFVHFEDFMAFMRPETFYRAAGSSARSERGGASTSMPASKENQRISEEVMKRGGQMQLPSALPRRALRRRPIPGVPSITLTCFSILIDFRTYGLCDCLVMWRKYEYCTHTRICLHSTPTVYWRICNADCFTSPYGYSSAKRRLCV